MIVLPGGDPAAVERAAAAVAAGNVVAFPTDTAYGLGARPDRPAAVDAIYRLKGRAPGQPLILLAAAAADLADWGRIPPEAEPLIARWWPGPLTLVVPAGPRTPFALRGPDETIGLRVPADPVAEALLRATGPLATTSANRSGAPSPRSAGDVAAAFAAEEAPAILLDGGPTRFRADSTVLTLAGPPRILRAGVLTPADLGLADHPLTRD